MMRLPTRTAGEKRQAELSAERSLSQASCYNKRHCNDATMMAHRNRTAVMDPEVGIVNPKKRSGGVLVDGSNLQHLPQQQQQQQQQHNHTCSSKKSKTHNSATEEWDDNRMELSDDETEPPPSNRNAANDVWQYIGIG